ncbi:DUF669 domain-containing protein [bacterium]|nr:DUF669 domain-containing protein [bacterium]
MDDLLNIASKTMEGFNPATDSVDDFEKLPDGEYNCLLEDVTARKSEKGTNWVSFKFSVMEGEYANRLIFVNFYFTEKTMARSVKAISKLAYDFGYELPLEAFSSYETLAETLNGLAGNQAIVKQTTSKNDFTNYTVTPIE